MPPYCFNIFLSSITFKFFTNEEKKIYDNVVGSLYESGKGIRNGVITSGKARKQMPVITDFYKKWLLKNRENSIEEHRKAYRIILDSLKDRVRELYYCPDCLEFFSREKFKETKGNCPCGAGILKIQGAKAYYDGQSTIKIKENERFTNIDISQLPESERPIARQIGLSFLNEQFIKKMQRIRKRHSAWASLWMKYARILT